MPTGRSTATVEGMWSLLRTPRWQGFTVLVIVAIVGFGMLSSWQWSRAEEERQARNAQIAQTETERTSLSAALSALDGNVPDDLRRPIEVTGVYEPEGTVLVRQRPLDGRNGFWVATPLRVTAGSVGSANRIWVNRGWIPATAAATATVTPPPPPVDEVRIFGWLVPSEITREVITDLPAGQVRWLDTAELDNFAAPPLPVYIERTASDPGEPDLLALPLPLIDETQNISYAVQWLVFAAIALSGWFFFLRREAREDSQREASAAAHSPSANYVRGSDGANYVRGSD